MSPKKIVILSLLTHLIASATAHAENRQFEVQEWCFSRGIDMAKNAPIDCLPDPAEAKGKDNLYLWMQISVNENGIRYLRGLHKLPIYHAWGRNGWIEGRTIDIGLDTRRWRNAMEDIEKEIRLRNGTFEWRTYSEKVGYISDGQHYVSVLDAQKHTVVLSRDRYTAFRPSVQINVKEN